MSKKHEAILIDPAERSISVIEDHSEDLKEIYKTLNCDCICSVQMPFNHVMFLDDNGLIRPIKEVNKRGLFHLTTHSKPFAGRGLIFHGTPEGNIDSAFLLVEQIEGMVRWRPKSSPMTEAEQKVVTELKIIPFGGISKSNEQD